MANLTGKQPDYAKLKCPKCGNAEDFKEFALTPTAQYLSVNGGEVDWKDTEFLDDTTFPQEVRCVKCDAVVWLAENNPQPTIKNDRQREILKAALSFAFSNLDDLNEAVSGIKKKPFEPITEDEMEHLHSCLLGKGLND